MKIRQFLLLLLLAMSWRQASAQNAFVFEDPLRFNYSAFSSSGNTASFLVFSKGCTINKTSVRSRSAKDGDGQTLPPEAVTATLSSDQITEDGNVVTLKITPGFFSKAGEYHVILAFQGMGADKKPIKALASIVIVHTAAEINVDQLK